MSQSFARKQNLNNIQIADVYDTGWINRSDWTNVHLGSDDTKDTDSNVTHNLNANLSELIIKVLISTDGTDDNCFEWKVDGTSENSTGYTAFQIDENNLQIQTGSAGIIYLDTSGNQYGIDSEDWYYKIKVIKIKENVVVVGDDYLSTGSGAPSSTPVLLGARYLDTTANREYLATGTGSSADWDKVPMYYSGTTTITGSAGDVTITLPWDWSGGYLVAISSRTQANYYDSAGNYCVNHTSYDALTSATYTDEHILNFVNDATDIYMYSKSTNNDSCPKSATTTSFTLDDNGTTVYVKYFVWA